ncbi:MAG: hypothetical protein R3C58_12810 [Parvularculaceae bacterium]
MNRKTTQRLAVAASIFCAADATSGGALAQKLPWLLPSCDSERGVSGWIVTASLVEEKSSRLIISKWEASHDYSSDFGLSISYDTSDSTIPSVLVHHNHRGGDFTMRLHGGASFTAPLSANYSVTQLSVPQEVIDNLRAAPLFVEYYNSGDKWNRYETVGLPQAIIAAEADLALAKERLGRKECKANKG